MTAQEVLAELARRGVSASGLSDDTRTLRRGEIFLARSGARDDGRRHIDAALARGAVAVLYEATAAAPAPLTGDVPCLGIAGLHAISGELAHALAGQPSRRLRLIAVTGSNGKTSCTQWIARAHPQQCALIGTLGAGFPGQLDATGFTTPQAPTLARHLAAFADAGASACALEASSIGIAEGRLDGAEIDSAIFTNLSRDHLDYHGSMENYAAAKERLFTWPGLRAVVSNLDDPLGRRLPGLSRAALKIGYTLQGMQDVAAPDAAVNFLLRASDLRQGDAGLIFTLHTPEGSAEVVSQLAGRYNVANLLAVAGALFAAGVALADLPARLGALSAPPGRMQRVASRADEPLLIVDYAHSPDALANALDALVPSAAARGGRLCCVFGCGGERDRGKRPLMGEVAARLADRVIITSDNPRGEDALTIARAIAEAAPAGEIIIDRAQAINAAVLAAAPADVILIAGKGHETTQEIAGVCHPFSDQRAAEAALVLRREAA